MVLCARQTECVPECIIGVGEIQLAAKSPSPLRRY